MFKKFFSIFLVYLFLAPSFAYSIEFSQSNELSSVQEKGVEENDLENGFVLSDEVPNTVIVSFQSSADANKGSGKKPVCTLTSLTEEEVQALKDKIRKEGITVEEIGSGVKVDNPEKLSKNEAILTHRDENFGSKVSLPDEKILPEQASWILNTKTNGAFSFGVVLDDTLRVGRCVGNVRDVNACAVEGAKLFLRNSGTGIKPIIVNTVKATFNELVQGKTRDNSISPEQLKSLQETYNTSTAEGDLNLPTKQAKRISGELIANTIEVQDFTVKMESNSKKGAISTYSLFDKYFNSVFSTEMVASIGLPTLAHRARKLLGYGKLRLGDYWPFELKKRRFARKLEAFIANPETFLGNSKINRWRARIKKFPEVGEVHYDMVLGTGGSSGYHVIKGGSFQNWIREALRPEGVIGKIKDPQVKEELVRYIGEFEYFTRTVETIADAAKEKAAKEIAEATVKKTAGQITEEELGLITSRAKLDQARVLAQLMQQVDDIAELDLPEYYMRKQEFGWPGKGVFNKKLGTYQDVYEDSTNYDMGLFDPFINDGKWTKDNTFFETDDFGNLVLYEMKPHGTAIGEIAKDQLDLVIAEGKYVEKMTQLKTGEYVLINSNNKDVILKHADSPIKIYDKGWQKMEKPLTPVDLSDKLTDAYVYKRMTKYASFNTQGLKNTLLEHNFSSRKYTSILDKQFAQEGELIREYFTLKGGLKFTAEPIAYWWARKGFGIEDISFYRLPDEWKRIDLVTGEEPIYEDAFVDFFANEGSDQGDLFIQVIDKLPWKVVYNKAVETFAPDAVQDTYDYITGVDRRDEVENLIFYLRGPKNCSDCSITLSTQDLKDFSPSFYSSIEMDAFLLEETLKGAKQGQLLVAYAHHTDLQGKSFDKDANPEPIDLVEARKNENTCRDKVKKLAFGLDIGTSVGGIVALGESISYMVFGWPALFGTIASQMLYIPELNGCVDDQEGYYVHFFAPNVEQKKAKEDPTELASEKAANFVQKIKDDGLGLIKGDTNSFVDTKLKQVEEKLGQFVQNTAAKDIVEAELHSNGFTSGGLKGVGLFYFWLEGGSELSKSKYLEKGKTFLTGKTALDEEGKRREVSIELDNETGTLKVDGNEILSSEHAKDAVRLSAPNLKIPAYEIANRLTKARMPSKFGNLFEIQLSGRTTVLDDDVLDCIQKAVEFQSGLPLKSKNIDDAFGPANSLTTNSHPSINLLPLEKKIVAEGAPRKVIIGQESKVIVANNRDVNLVSSKESFPTGKFESLKLENGEILYKASTDELVIWIKRHKDAIMESSEVQNLKADLTKTINPETGCEETAIDLSVRGLPTDLGLKKEANFNKALQRMGPFQVFDTDRYTFIFYSEKVNGICQERFRRIDKITGEVYDQEIVSPPKKTDKGIEFTTADGKKHALDFSAPNGVPTLTYNGESGTLKNAQGKNGSFWYDPDKGLMYADNSQLIPLLEAFKQAGLEFKGRGDGTATATAGNNIFIGPQEAGATNPLANLPSLPENSLLAVLMIAVILSAILLIQNKS